MDTLRLSLWRQAQKNYSKFEALRPMQAEMFLAQFLAGASLVKNRSKPPLMEVKKMWT